MDSEIPIVELIDDEDLKRNQIIILDEVDDEIQFHEVPLVTLEDECATEPPVISLDEDEAETSLYAIADEFSPEISFKESDNLRNSSKNRSKSKRSADDLVITLDDSAEPIPPLNEYKLFEPVIKMEPSSSKSDDTEVDSNITSDSVKSVSIPFKRLHSCKNCFKMFPTVQKLNNHSCLIGKKQFLCSSCNETFNDKILLSKHLKSHDKDKPYICDICFKQFSDKNILRMHYNTHTGEKPFACTICDKVFPNTLTLKNHYEMHTGEKPYVCDVCLTSFDHKTSLCNHKLEEHKFLTVI